jgi:hypothetical protein
MTKSNKLHRRTVLRGAVAGAGTAVVGLPLLEAMLNDNGTALAGGGSAKPVRLVTWFFGNGINRARFIPGGALTPVPGPDYPLTEHLMPLANVREYISIPTGFQNRCESQITHHEGMTLFNGYTFDQTCQSGDNCFGFYSNAGGPTIDQVAASLVGNQTTIPSIQVGVSKKQSGADFGTTMHALSHKSTLEPLYPQLNPQDVYYSLFGNFTPPEDPSKDVRLSALSAVNAQIGRLRQRLGARDKARLEAHLDGISELEAKISALPPVCTVPSMPTETNTDVGGVEPLISVNEAMSDLLAYAFACDVTRIASVLFHEGASDTVFPGTALDGHHSHSHGFAVDDNGFEVDYGGLAGFNAGMLFTMGQLAYFLEKLKNTADGEMANLLDNCAILIGSDNMDGWSHDYQDRLLFCMVAGGGGGRLVHPGIHCVEPGRNVCDVTLTVLQAAVPEVTSIGSGLAASSNPVLSLKPS